MKTNLIVALLVIAISSLACRLQEELGLGKETVVPPPRIPNEISGSIAVQGEGRWTWMAEAGFPGKTTVKLLPSPDDFRLTFDQAKFTFAGQAKFTLRVDEDYQLIDAFDTECSGSLTGSAELNYTGKSVGGNPSSAIFVGPIVSTGSATAPFQCPDAAGAFSGSDINPQGDITLTLQGLAHTCKWARVATAALTY